MRTRTTTKTIVLDLFIADYTSVVHYTRATQVRRSMSESSAAYSGSFIWIIVCIINFMHS